MNKAERNRHREGVTIAQRHKTIILLRVSTMAKPRPEGAGASRQRRGSGRPLKGLFFSGLHERNKIKILLRSAGSE